MSQQPLPWTIFRRSVLSSVFAVNADKNLAVVKQSSKYVLIDTKETDVISTSATFCVPDDAGWLLNPDDRAFPDTWFELAEAATSTFAVKETQSADENKVFRVPKKVQEENLGPQSLMTLAEIHEFSNSDAYAFTPGVPHTVEWVEKILKMHPNPATALTASAFVVEEGTEYFGIPVDPDEPFSLISLLALQPDKTWAVRVPGGWEALGDAPAENIVMLDFDSAELLAEWVDHPDAHEGPALEFSNLYPNEYGLFASAESELDTEFLDRLFDIYDPYERSVNAQKQVRGTGGKFAPNPGAGEATPEKPKARLATSLPLIPNIAERISQYLDQIDEQRKQSAPAEEAPAPEAEPAKKEMSLQDRLAAKKAELDWQTEFWNYYDAIGEFAISADSAGVATTEVRPLYIAIVDSIDTDAVLDLVALVPPKAGTQGDVSAWKRAAQKWISAPEILQQLRGSTPPACVELSDENTLKNLVEQVDKSTQEEPVEEAPAPPGQTEVDPATGNPVPVTASAALTAALASLKAEGSLEISEELFADAVEKGIAVEVGVNDDGVVLYDLQPETTTGVLSADAWRRQEGFTEITGELTLSENTLEFIKELAQKTSLKKDSRDAAADKGEALPDGSYPIKNKEDLKKAVQAYGRAKDKAKAKRHIIKRARALKATDLLPDDWTKSYTARGFAFTDGSLLILDADDVKSAVLEATTDDQQLHVIKRARALNRLDLIPTDWDPQRDYYALEIDLWGPYGELLPVVAAGGLDRNRGNAERLRHYWTYGPGGAKIGWGTGGDWTRCVAHLSKYLGNRAKGYCALRHHEMNGYWPGDRRNL